MWRCLLVALAAAWLALSPVQAECFANDRGFSDSGGVLCAGSAGAFALDQQPSAFSAYSLRRLRTLYTANKAVNLRCPSGTNGDVGFTPAGGLNMAQVAALANGGQCFVTKQYDQSGNGRDASQATAASQPQIVLTLAALNNRPALLFGDASAFELDTASIVASIFSAGGFYSSVVNFSGTNTAFDRFFQHGSALLALTTSKLNFQQPASTTNGSWTDNATISAGAHVVDALYSSSANANVPTLAVDGANRTVTSTQPVGTITVDSGVLSIGNSAGNRGFPGYMAENVFFATQPSAGQITALRANQKAYWGTP